VQAIETFQATEELPEEGGTYTAASHHSPIWRESVDLTLTLTRMHIINALPDYYTATALFDFEGQNEQELSFKAGDVIVLTDYSDEVRTACWSLLRGCGV
jgi:hypothetical protein